MLVNVSPEKIAPVCFRYALATLPIGAAFAACGATSWMFALDSLILDGYLIHHAWRFKQVSGSE